jgi:large subunit ribosomal protein L53
LNSTFKLLSSLPFPERPAAMITRFLTEVSTRFNPFSARAKTARSFLALLPPNARSTMKVDIKMLPQHSKEKTMLAVKFSM